MTEPPAGWSSPSGEPAPSYGPPPGADTPVVQGYGPTYAGPPGGWYGGPPPTPAPGVVPLRPLTVGELLDGAVKVIRRYPRPTIGLSAVVALVTTLLNVVSVLFMDFSDEVATLQEGASSTEVGFGSGVSGGELSGVAGGIVSIPAGIFLTGVLIAVVGRAVLGQEATIGEVWQQVRPRIWALIGLALLTSLIAAAPLLVVGILLALAIAAGAGGGVIVLAVLLLLGALGFSAYLYVRLSLAPAALVLEKAGIRTSLRRSGELVKGAWWRVFGLLLLTAIIELLVTSVLVMPLTLLGSAILLASPTGGEVALFVMLSQVASGLAACLVSPFTAGVRALLYVDRRMRAEALDLTLQAAARA
jgi:hypothetical protein